MGGRVVTVQAGVDVVRGDGTLEGAGLLRVDHLWCSDVGPGAGAAAAAGAGGAVRHHRAVSRRAGVTGALTLVVAHRKRTQVKMVALTRFPQCDTTMIFINC